MRGRLLDSVSWRIAEQILQAGDLQTTDGGLLVKSLLNFVQALAH